MEMMVTDIAASDRKRLRISLNHAFAFWIYQSDYRKYSVLKVLELGAVVEGEQLNQIYREVLLPRAKSFVLYLFDRSERSEMEVRQKLRQKEYPEEIYDEVIDYLKQYHYLDEERIVRSCLARLSASKSRQVIVGKLIQKGISRELIERVMEEEEYSGQSAAVSALKKKLHSTKIEKEAIYEISWEEKQKINACLYRKGFSSREIQQAWAEL